MAYDTFLVITFLILFGLVALYAVAVPQGGRRWWGLLALLAVLVLAGTALDGEWLRMILVDAATFVAVVMVAIQNTPEAKRAARSYLVLMLLAVVCIGAGLLLSPTGASDPGGISGVLVASLLVVGFGLKLALVPFYFWLPTVAASAAPMTTALIISVVDVAALGELVHLRQTLPWVFTGHTPLWLLLALLSMLGGALLALAQRDLKRMLAFSTIDDMGYLLLGVLAGPGVGLMGAMLGAVSHALFKVLLFGAVGIAERGTGAPLTLDRKQGLAARFPMSGAAFVVGALGMVGVPPLFGFVGRWRLYLAGLESGGIALVLALVVATGLALLYYARAIHLVWLGTPGDPEQPVSEPRLAAATLGLLSAAALVLGLFPGWLTALLA
jgi:multicomponent Na+:H+ antiporter subunit D